MNLDNVAPEEIVSIELREKSIFSECGKLIPIKSLSIGLLEQLIDDSTLNIKVREMLKEELRERNDVCELRDDQRS